MIEYNNTYKYIHKSVSWFLFYFHLVLPPSSPSIQTNQLYYTPGDVLRANCTSGPSRPASELALFINDMPVSIIIVIKIVIRVSFSIVPIDVVQNVRIFSSFEHYSIKIFRN